MKPPNTNPESQRTSTHPASTAPSTPSTPSTAPQRPSRPSVPSVAPKRASQSGLPSVGGRRPSQRSLRAAGTAPTPSQPPPRRRARLGDILIEANLVQPEQIESALRESKLRPGSRIGEVLVRMGAISESTLTQVLGRKFSMPVVDLDATPIDPAAWREAPLDVMQRVAFLPLSSDSRSVRVAIADPLNGELTDLLRFHLGGKQLQEVLAVPSQLKRHVQRFLHTRQSQVASQRIDAILKEMSVEPIADNEDSDADTLMDSDSAVIKLVNQMILDAWERKASDIHVEPRGPDHALSIRFRIDGECVAYQKVPAAFRAPLISRLKIIAGLDISERRKPQAGQDRVCPLRRCTLQRLYHRLPALPAGARLTVPMVRRVSSTRRP